MSWFIFRGRQKDKPWVALRSNRDRFALFDSISLPEKGTPSSDHLFWKRLQGTLVSTGSFRNGIIKVSQLGPAQIKLSWTGTPTKNYKVLGTVNILSPDHHLNWQTVAQDIPGVDGIDATSVKLDISGGPQYTFLRVMPVP